MSDISVSELIRPGPSCCQLLITITGEMELSQSDLTRFEALLRKMGITIDWRNTGGARGIEYQVFLNLERCEDQRKHIAEFK